MSQSKQYMLLWLEGPLQSWGFDSKFDVRDTLNFPTRSGILGLICCARGAAGPEVEWLAEMNNLSMEVRAYARTDKQGQPHLREPTLCDFQMVGSGYDDSDPWQSLLIPRKSDRTKAGSSAPKMTYRYYLQDAVFAVVMALGSKQAELLPEALQNPVWDLYLGRKSCVPTELIYQGIFDSAESAWQQAQKLADSKQRALSYTVMEGEGDGDVITLNDVPLQFGRHKRYRDRQVTVLEFG
ncbi:TPA: type I-E CRISPR-associated protein Cas5/CasD [Klebsiella pneumoniae]|uniref:type I-E CRISPR-associated protein Cas5/CasD n=1 Tax=Klebsiella pneumoniae TaxID=573 RepID=UPI0022ACBB95|nr:type I-E CRISPR-associated protein Cas5/CasD [Klebsiella pneumoniae]MCP6099530.1 type I-E CRISPR-associated protein Cas5/CasD [Klebsiella pneumoniae]MCP6256581.1 type I-E CRISPR-associated protein Cas5/CasD [Klebsiella pneumoniae]MDN2648051.1 type I-E CRISPR-associated protein Cas5/CasD [Klebsiella pneumoniae]WKF98242.1 type I-E CRISPR-associated protein Cas5/CasD [Klebsiella pneumoniae]HCB1202166.1 type I-E CRISPR-associated protein Cas5/CasD [Klebsiella pneumoniae]